MVQEAYVSFETAKLLKEKGFNEGCSTTYTSNGMFHTHNYSPLGSDIFAPTLQMAMCWLREEKHYYIQIMLDSWALGSHSGYYIVIQDINSDYDEISPETDDGVIFYHNYEKACEEAIKYCLKNLI